MPSNPGSGSESSAETTRVAVPNRPPSTSLPNRPASTSIPNRPPSTTTTRVGGTGKDPRAAMAAALTQAMTQPTPTKPAEAAVAPKPRILLLVIFLVVCIAGGAVYLLSGSGKPAETAENVDRVEKLEKTMKVQELTIGQLEKRIMKLEAESAKQTQMLEAIKKYITENTGGAQPR